MTGRRLALVIGATLAYLGVVVGGGLLSLWATAHLIQWVMTW